MNRLPAWLKQDIPDALVWHTAESILKLRVNTVCRQALCPNISDCFRRNQVTFLILGKSCTRSCVFCNVHKNRDGSIDQTIKNRTVPRRIDHHEPGRIAQIVKLLSLEYVVVTSVTRDDLDDGGAGQFVKVIESIRAKAKFIKIEVLIPDFQGNMESLKTVVNARPFILAHNLETTKCLYSTIRPEADYQRSLMLLKKAKELAPGLITKSSLMLGLGEREEEVISALRDLRSCDCDIVTLGQYLSPSPQHYPVKEFISPELFRKYSDIGMGLGFKKVLSGPKVRSSYYAKELSRGLADA